MPLELKSVVPGDAYRAAEIEALSYAPNSFTTLLFPGPMPENAREMRAQGFIKEIEEATTLRCLKVVDTDLADGPEQMVAFARWHIYLEPQTPSPPSATTSRAARPGCNDEACDMLFGGIELRKQEIMGGKPYVYLQTLYTDPKHQRRGAASMLIKWGLEEAQKLGLPAFLDASEEGHSVYTKMGFKDIDLQELDFSKWGAKQTHKNWAMIWEPAKQN
ncbi:putative GNAT family acetyltransferase [Xylariales sp. PMI_506]|nr:putative GNAT family acetyltransferase [Xylariales sp. PMI_506]